MGASNGAPPPAPARRRATFPVVNPAPAGERQIATTAGDAPGVAVPTQPAGPRGQETRPTGRIRNVTVRDNSADVPGDYSGRKSRLPRPVKVIGDRMQPYVPTPPTGVRSPAQVDDGLPSCRPGDKR